MEQSQEQEIVERGTKRSNSSFKFLNIAQGEEISFLYDDTITAKVVNDKNQIEYEGANYSVTALARRLLIDGLKIYMWMAGDILQKTALL